MATINLGKIAISIKGEWAASTAYKINDAVYFKGMTFICVKEHTSGNNFQNSPLFGAPAERGSTTVANQDKGAYDYRSSRRKFLPSGRGAPEGSVPVSDSGYLHEDATSVGRVFDHINYEHWEPLGTGNTSYYVRGGDTEAPNHDYQTSTTRDVVPGNIYMLNGGIYLYNGHVRDSGSYTFCDNPMTNYYGGWQVLHEGDIIPRHRAISVLDGSPPPYWQGHPNPTIIKPTWGNSSYAWRGNVPRNIPTYAKKPEYNWRAQGSDGYGAEYWFINWHGETITMGNDGGYQMNSFNSYGGNGFFGAYNPTIHKDYWDSYIAKEQDYGWGLDQKKNDKYFPGLVTSDQRRELTWHGSNPHYMVTRHANTLSNFTTPATVKPKGIQIEHGGYRSVSTLMSDGTVQVYGYNGYYMYGTHHGTAYPTGSHLGRDVFNGKRIVKLAGTSWDSANSAGTMMALDEDGEIWTWGYNGYGQCGGTRPNHGTYGGYYNGVHENFRNPTKLVRDIFFEDREIVDIWAYGGQYGTMMALDTGGNLWSWGYNGYGQLGYPTNTYQNTDRSQVPVKINVNWNTYAGIQKVISYGVESTTAMAVLDGQGQVWTCGYNGWGQLGSGDTTNTNNAGSLTRRTGWTGLSGNIINIWGSGGGSTVLWLLKSDGTVWGVGNNGSYQLSLSNATHQYTPVQAQNLTWPIKMGYAGRSGGVDHYALDRYNRMWAIGWNGYGSLGFGNTGTVHTNNNRNQTNGEARYGWQKMAMPSALYNRISNFSTQGYYDGSISHHTTCIMQTNEGEILTTGRGYWWGTGMSNNHHYRPRNHGLWGS